MNKRVSVWGNVWGKHACGACFIEHGHGSWILYVQKWWAINRFRQRVKLHDVCVGNDLELNILYYYFQWILLVLFAVNNFHILVKSTYLLISDISTQIGYLEMAHIKLCAGFCLATFWFNQILCGSHITVVAVERPSWLRRRLA